MKAIETKYKGYRFRSRLEARWAVFFDALGIKWEYEPEGFDLGGGCHYLPDFKTTSPTGLVAWYEVKPRGQENCEKFSLFSKWIRALEKDDSCRLLSGDPVDVIETHRPRVVSGRYGEFEADVRVCPRCGVIHTPEYGWGYANYAEIRYGCESCDFDTPSGGGNESEDGLLALVTPHKGDLLIIVSEFHKYLSKVEIAAVAARSARFEHGESGARRG